MFIAVALSVSGGFFYLRSKLISPKPNKVAPTQTPSKELKVRGSIPYWDQTTAVTTFEQNFQQFNSINLFWYFVDATGKVKPYTDAVIDPAIVIFAKDHGVKVNIVITNLPEEVNTTWDSKRVELILNNAHLRSQFIQSVHDLLKNNWYDGVSIDFEELDNTDPQVYSRFIKDLANSLHKDNFFVGVALHPKKGSETDKVYKFQDWKTLADAADELYIMSYEEHYDDGTPGPVATTDWDTEILTYLTSLKVPLDKFYLGVPLYGYDWNTTKADKARGLTYGDARLLMKQYGITKEWGGDTPTPYFSYTDKNGDKHEVWFESADSAMSKIKLAQKFGVGGITFWRLGEEDPALWRMLSGQKKASP